MKYKKNEIIIENIIYDGNCFYRTISAFLFGRQDYYALIRNILFNYVSNKKNEIIMYSPYVDYFGALYYMDNYINIIQQNYFYVRDLEIAQTPYCFNINAGVYSLDCNSNIFNLYTNNENNSQNIQLLLLNYDNNIQHYQLCIIKIFIK